MRLIYLIAVPLVSIVSCGPAGNGSESTDPEAIAFVTNPVQSPSLLVKPTLRLLPRSQRLQLDVKLESLVPEKITVHEISLNNASGVNSSFENIAVDKPVLPGDGDTTLSAMVNHINDRKLFLATGLPGLADSIYALSVYYSVDGKEGLRVVNLVSRMPPDTFSSYRKANDSPVRIYHLDTANEFEKNQRDYLVSNGISGPTPFVHVTEQELAVSGLNFRVRCFSIRDTLRAEIFVVNHSGMTVKIDTTKIRIVVEGKETVMHDGDMRIEKVTGSKADGTLLRKGDRMLINLRCLDAGREKVQLTFAGSFLLSDGRALFYGDPALISVD